MSGTTLDTVERGTWSMREMRGLVISEFRKTRATSAWWALLILGLILSLGLALPKIREEYLTHSLAIGLAWAYLSALLFGVVCATAEYRHNTITTSYLAAANRPKLVVAKMICSAIVGAAYGIICAAATVAGIPLTGARYGAEWPWILAVSGGGMLVFALWAILGVGLGTLVGNRMVAVFVALLGQLLIQPLIQLAVVTIDGWDRFTVYLFYLPDPAATAFLLGLTGGEQFEGGFGVATSWWLTLLVASGWAAVLVVAGIAVAQRRDIT